MANVSDSSIQIGVDVDEKSFESQIDKLSSIGNKAFKALAVGVGAMTTGLALAVKTGGNTQQNFINCLFNVSTLQEEKVSQDWASEIFEVSEEEVEEHANDTSTTKEV